MIRDFKDGRTEEVFDGRSPKGFPADLARAARRKLRMLNAAPTLDSLRAPPGTGWRPCGTTGAASTRSA